MDVQKFNEIYSAMQDANQEVSASEDELEKFAEAQKSIEQIRNRGQQDMEKIITDNVLSVARYQEIMIAIQGDPELQQKLQNLIAG